MALVRNRLFSRLGLGFFSTHTKPEIPQNPPAATLFSAVRQYYKKHPKDRELARRENEALLNYYKREGTCSRFTVPESELRPSTRKFP